MRLLKRFAHYYKPHRFLFSMDLLAAFFMAACDLFYPMLTRRIINDYIPGHKLQLFFGWVIAMLLIYLVKTLLTYFTIYWGHTVGVRIQADMRRDLFSHIQTLPFSFFDENKTGALLSRVVNDTFEITELAHHGPEDLFISFVTLILSFILLGRINLVLTLIIFIFVPLLILFAMKLRKLMIHAFARSRQETASINAEIENSLSGIRVAKAFDNADYENEKFARSNRSFVQARMGVYRVMAVFNAGMQLGIDLLPLLALACSGFFALMGWINIGDLAAFILYISMFTSPIRRLNQFVELFQDGMSGFERFCQIMDTTPEPEPQNPQLPGTFSADIAFQEVSFQYDENKSVLEDINVTVPRGQTVALVGPSGGGKTTFCHLIPRFYVPTGGKVLIGGIDVQDIPSEALRRNIGLVQQDVFLFSGTIRENIAYGRLDATDEEIVTAAIEAELHDTIMAMPDGYDTDIGERGVKLSGGQKQRIAIARVFLKDPPILILDEATSALDTVTEQAIQKSFEHLSHGRTTLVVAHRLSTVRGADRILVLTDKGIEESGNHDELLAQKGLYAKLYQTQFSIDFANL